MQYRLVVIFTALLVLASGKEVDGHGHGGHPHHKQALVNTSQGQLIGKTLISYGGRPFLAYLGIPYAAPPTGDLRFKAPEFPLAWEGIRNATLPGSICPQTYYINETWQVQGDEDCLFLNVYVPETNQTNLPVMIWFHDGAFVWGTGNPSSFGADYLMDEDVIIVTINYRLGILGFLSTDDDSASGNWGLKDQVASLKWVQNNIAAFKGDPNKVTIFGGSAGGASVQYHILSPLSRGLFHRAISQSGVALAYWAFTNDQQQKAFRAGQLLGCSPTGSNTTELVNCLRTKSFSSISEALLQFWEWQLDPMVSFGPVVEPESAGNDRFLHKHPKELLETGEYSQLPWMTGINPNDGEFQMSEFFNNDTLRQDMSDNYRHLLPIVFGFQDVNNSAAVAESIWSFYLGNSSMTEQNVDNVTNMYSDRMFIVPAVHSANLQASTSSAPVYFYRFNFHGNRSHCDPKLLGGVCHADDLEFVFNLFGGSTYDNATQQDELRIKDIFIELWTNFAKTGNPTPSPSSLVPFTWSPVTPDHLNFLQINLEPQMKEGMYEDRVKFWDSLPLPENTQ